MKRTGHDREKIDREVEQTIAGLDAAETVEVGPHFYARLAARLREADAIEPNYRWSSLFRGRLAASLLSIVIILNAVTTIVVISDLRDGKDDYRKDTVEAVADEYSLPGASLTLDLELK